MLKIEVLMSGGLIWPFARKETPGTPLGDGPLPVPGW